MATVVLVHGIWNRQRGMTPEEAAVGLAQANAQRLQQGFADGGLSHVPLPEVVMAYYAHLLKDDWEAQAGEPEQRLDSLSNAELEQAWEWLVAAGVPEPEEPQAAFLAPVRQGLGWLVRHRTGDGLAARIVEQATERLSRLIVATLQDTDAYTSRPERRRAVREIVAEAIRSAGPDVVVVAHSLGSVVAYETLHAFPDLKVELLVTLGSPLGLPAMMRKLEPEPRSGRGARPSGLSRWVNIADVGDLVAVPMELGGAFPVDLHETTDIGILNPHTLGGYLANGLTAVAIAPYVSS